MPKRRSAEWIDQLIRDAREAFAYNPRTGTLRWRKKHHHHKPGGLVGTHHPNGLVCRFRGETHQVHRLAYLIFHGKLPLIVTHLNDDLGDNRIRNLAGTMRRRKVALRWPDKAA